jgi:hypothetical protein
MRQISFSSCIGRLRQRPSNAPILRVSFRELGRYSADLPKLVVNADDDTGLSLARIKFTLVPFNLGKAF